MCAHMSQPLAVVWVHGWCKNGCCHSTCTHLPGGREGYTRKRTLAPLCSVIVPYTHSESVLFTPSACTQGSASCLQDLLEDLFSRVNQQQDSNGSSSAGTDPVCISSSGISILPARVAAAPAPVQLQRSGSRDSGAAAEAAKQAAERAAALNADAGNAQGYTMSQVGRAPWGRGRGCAACTVAPGGQHRAHGEGSKPMH